MYVDNFLLREKLSQNISYKNGHELNQNWTRSLTEIESTKTELDL